MYQNTKEWNKHFEDDGYSVLPFHKYLAERDNGFYWFASQWRASIYNGKPYIHKESTVKNHVIEYNNELCEMAVDYINKLIANIKEERFIISIYGLFIYPDDRLVLRYSIIRENNNKNGTIKN